MIDFYKTRQNVAKFKTLHKKVRKFDFPINNIQIIFEGKFRFELKRLLLKMRRGGEPNSIKNGIYLKDTHREKTPSNKTLALTKGTNMGIRVVGTSNQFFIRGSIYLSIGF